MLWHHCRFQLLVRASCGNNLVLYANAWDKIIFLKTQIEQKTHIPPALQCLIHGCEPLNDHDTLDQCNLRHHSMLDMFPCLRGGMQNQMEGIVTCKICQQNLAVTKFSNSQLKKLRKAKAKGNSIQIVCTTCTRTNKPNKGESGSVANNQQRSSKANASSSQPAAATRSTHNSTAKRKLRDRDAKRNLRGRDKQQRKVRRRPLKELSHNHNYLQPPVQRHLQLRLTHSIKCTRALPLIP